MMKDSQLLEQLEIKALDFNIKLDKTKLNQFKIYYEFLVEYSKHTNLISSAGPEDIFKRHFLDSLSIGLLKDNIEVQKVVDIGIGGGFPGVPMLIAFPDMKLCAVDSVGKKIKFLQLLCEKLGLLDRVTFINGRAEELGRSQEHRERYDLAVTRAVGQLALISEYCLPLVKLDGNFVAYKAKNIDQEILQAKNALSHLGGKVLKTVEYNIIEKEDIERNLVLINKFKKTPMNFPRAIGLPKKKPL